MKIYLCEYYYVLTTFNGAGVDIEETGKRDTRYFCVL